TFALADESEQLPDAVQFLALSIRRSARLSAVPFVRVSARALERRRRFPRSARHRYCAPPEQFHRRRHAGPVALPREQSAGYGPPHLAADRGGARARKTTGPSNA